MGENMKLEMLMEWADVATPAAAVVEDPDEVKDPDEADDPEPPLLQAARSSAPARTRTTAPPRSRVADARTVQTAWDVGLKARGVPEELCAPGYIPST
jgi:hypothetical protein